MISSKDLCLIALKYNRIHRHNNRDNPSFFFYKQKGNIIYIESAYFRLFDELED